MRRLAGIGTLLCILAGCQNVPSVLRIEVDGATLELKKKAPPASAPPVAESNSVDVPAP